MIALHRRQGGGEHHLRERPPDLAPLALGIAERRILVGGLPVEHRLVQPSSEQVDAAWHLHLTYTRSYWDRFCKETLGQPLHHDPTRGGPAEADTRSPEATRNMMILMQQGWERGRADDLNDSAGTPDDGTER